VPYNKQLQRTVERHRGAPQVRHFIVHMRRAGERSAPPLNCGVMWHRNVLRILPAMAEGISRRGFE
jgi:hypothetical protein